MLRMARDRKDGDDCNSLLSPGFIGTVMPKDSIRARGVVLGVGPKYLFADRARQQSELMRMKALMVWVDFQVADGLPNLLEERGF